MNDEQPKTNRVCMITEGFYPPSVGGQQKLIHDLAAKLLVCGQDVMVITRQADPPAAPREVVDRIPVLRVPPGGQLTGRGWHAIAPLMLFLVRLFVLLIKERQHYDILLVSGLKILPIPGMCAAFLLRKRCIIRPESPIELWQDISAMSMQRMAIKQSSWLITLLRTVRYWLLRRADRVIAVSSQMKTGLLEACIKPDRIVQIPHGIDIDRFSPADLVEKARLRITLGLPLSSIIFIFTGRLAISKGLPELIHAWQQVAQLHVAVLLLLVGSGVDSFDNFEPQLRQYITQHNLQASVVCTGAVNNVDDYLRASDVFVFPSHYEGFGLSIVEAMACGLPAVVSRVGVVRDVLQNYQNGIVVKVDGEDELLAAMAWMLDHPETWTEMGTQARRDVIAKFSMDVVAGQYMAVFGDVVKDTALPAPSQPKHARGDVVNGD